MYYQHETRPFSPSMKIAGAVLWVFAILLGLACMLEIDNGTDTLPIFADTQTTEK